MAFLGRPCVRIARHMLHDGSTVYASSSAYAARRVDRACEWLGIICTTGLKTGSGYLSVAQMRAAIVLGMDTWNEEANSGHFQFRSRTRRLIPSSSTNWRVRRRMSRLSATYRSVPVRRFFGKTRAPISCFLRACSRPLRTMRMHTSGFRLCGRPTDLPLQCPR